MKRKLIVLILFIIPVYSYCQTIQSNQVIDITVVSNKTMKPLLGATITTSEESILTDINGKAMVKNADKIRYIEASHLGFLSRRIEIETLLGNSTILLEESGAFLEEVMVSTGYYSLPKERSTGSFTIIGKSILDKSIGHDILSKLEGVTSSLHFDRRFDKTEWTSGEPEIRVRGLSTINSVSKPLIILNNFPYDGDIDLINPEDIENVVISKDAAASSIWGARASNGVIVINTKNGKYNSKPRINFNTGLTMGAKPNLYYDPNFIGSSEMIDAERKRFLTGTFTETNATPLSPVIELLIEEREGEITTNQLEAQLDILKNKDVRVEALSYMYQKSNSQQYSFGINGGAEFINYYFSLGYDKSLKSIVGDKDSRLTFNTNNNFRIAKGVELNTNLVFLQEITKRNGIGLYSTNAANRSSYYPYATLREDGHNLSVLGQFRSLYVNQAEENGMLDWKFRPLDEIYLNDDQKRQRQFNFSSSLTVNLLPELTFKVLYNHQAIGNMNEVLHDKDSYYARNLVNRFTQLDGSRKFPIGQVYFIEADESRQHVGRTQLNYDRLLNSNQNLNILMGAEMRQVKFTSGPQQQLLGYDSRTLSFSSALDYTPRHRTNPMGSLATLPAPPYVMEELTDRFISYYANAAYDFDKRYVINSSARWDASNLFGVNINQKGVPLWSVGFSWHLMNESFYNSTLLPKLSMRLTHGINGNINNTISAFPAMRYVYNSALQLNTGNLMSPGNPNLKWETTHLTNIGVDFGFKQNRFSGSIDYYWKENKDLLGENILDPTVGISTLGGANIIYQVNYADLETKGFDIDVVSNNLLGSLKWSSNFILSYSSNKITRYHAKNDGSIYPYFQSMVAPPQEGVSRDVIYSLPWNGLSADNGNQYVTLNGELSQDYAKYITSMKVEDLVRNGTSVPPLTGSIRNSFSFRNIDLSFNILMKIGYHFRRNSIVYQSLFSSFVGHKDFSNRWSMPGDELTTTVPAFPSSISSTQDNVYKYSDILVEKGDHIRFHDVHMGYRFKNFYVQGYARNLGIIWRANKQKLDPDYPLARYPAPKTFGIKLQTTF